MNVIEIEKIGCRLFLEIDGKIREFFIITEIKKYSSFSSDIVKAGDCVAYTAKLAEIVDTECDSYGMFIRYSPQKYEYFRGYAGLDFKMIFQEL